MFFFCVVAVVHLQHTHTHTQVNQNVIILYVQHMKDKGYAETTIQSIYSQLKSACLVFDSVDFGKYAFSRKIVKDGKKSHVTTHAPIFTVDQIVRFFGTAPWPKYDRHLAFQVFGYSGRLRSEDYNRIFHECIQLLTSDNGLFVCLFVFCFCFSHLHLHLHAHTGTEYIRVDYYKGKSKKMAFFLISRPEWIRIIQRYTRETRHIHKGKGRFFFGKRRKVDASGNETWEHHAQFLGKAFYQSRAPKAIAEFLGLKNAKSFSGHSIPRTGTTIYAASGASANEVMLCFL